MATGVCDAFARTTKRGAKEETPSTLATGVRETD